MLHLEKRATLRSAPNYTFRIHIFGGRSAELQIHNSHNRRARRLITNAQFVHIHRNISLFSSHGPCNSQSSIWNSGHTTGRRQITKMQMDIGQRDIFLFLLVLQPPRLSRRSNRCDWREGGRATLDQDNTDSPAGSSIQHPLPLRHTNKTLQGPSVLPPTLACHLALFLWMDSPTPLSALPQLAFAHPCPMPHTCRTGFDSPAGSSRPTKRSKPTTAAHPRLPSRAHR